MGTTVAESRRSEGIQKHHINAVLHRNYESQVKHAFQELLDDFRGGIVDIEAQKSKFVGLFQSSLDPSLEIVWIIGALSFEALNLKKKSPSDQIAAIESIFQTIVSFSTSCDGTKIIVLLSMVIFEIQSVITDFLSTNRNRLISAVQSVLDRLLGYIGLCSRFPNYENSAVCSISSFVDLVRICMKDKICWSFDEMECIKLFFPFVSEKVLVILQERLFDVEYLAGIVITEAFMMKLCLKYDYETQGRQQLMKDLRAWAVCFISSHPCYTFFEILLRLLMEPTLPVTHMMKCDGEIFLRKIMYDAMVFPEYSFLKSDAVIARFDVLPVLRLLISHKAMEFYREKGDHTKVISYAKAFSSSTVPFQLTKLVQKRLGSEVKATKPDGSSTTAYLEWMLGFEKKGLSVLEDGHVKAEALSFSIGGRGRDFVSGTGGAHTAEMFFVDKGGEKEEDGSLSTAFIKASRGMGGDNCSGKKRKASLERTVGPPEYNSYVLYEPESEVDDLWSDPEV